MASILTTEAPTGSGKSTTLYAMLKALNMKSCNMNLTIENPVEYTIKGINQINVNPKAGNNLCKCALRSVLRQDPDIIMVGEIRDVSDQVAICYQSCYNRTILVLSTLHTRDAKGAIIGY